MSLLTVVQEAAEATGFESPTAVIGALDDNAKRFYRLAQLEANSLLRRHNWAVLLKDGAITGDGSADYALPSDYHRAVPATYWTSSANWRIGGSVSSQRWQSLQNGWAVSTSLSRQLMMRATSATKQIHFEPVLSTGETVVYDYISNAMFDDGAGTQYATWTDDAYTCLIDESLVSLGVIYRVLVSTGRDAAFAFSEYKEARDQLIGQDAPAERISLASGEFVLPAVTPETIPVP